MIWVSPPNLPSIRGLIAILFLVIIILPVSSAAGTATLIPGTSGADHPAIFGNTVIFERNGNIVLYNLSSGEEVVVQSGHSTLPDISGSRVVWQENEVSPAIWQITNSNIYLFDETTGSIGPLTPSPWAQKEPKISGDYVVWTDYRNYNGDIYLYNIATKKETPVCTDPAEQWSPHIYGNTIVWLDGRNGRGITYYLPFTTETAKDIYLYDIVTGTTRNLTPVSSEDSVNFPVISDKNIVWVDYASKNYNQPQLFWYSLLTGKITPLPISGGDLQFPALFGDTLIWKEIQASYYAPQRDCPTEMMGQCPVETLAIQYNNTYYSHQLLQNITKDLSGEGTGLSGYVSALQIYNNIVVSSGGTLGDGITIHTFSWDNTSLPTSKPVPPSRTTTLPLPNSPAPALRDATTAQGWADRGTYLMSKGAIDNAIAAFDISLAIDNRSAGAWAGKGMAHLASYRNHDSRLYEAKDAANAFEQAVALEPGNAEYWNYKGLAHYYYEEYGPAELAFNRAIAINPRFSDAWYNKGKVLERTKRYQDAMDAYAKALAENPGDTYALRDLNRMRAVLNLTPLTMSPTVKKTVSPSLSEKTPLPPFLPVLGIGAASGGVLIRRRWRQVNRNNTKELQ